MGNPNPFVIEEAAIAVGVVTSAEDPTLIDKWIGGCAQGIVLSKDFAEQRLEYPGVAYAKVRHVDENHALEIANIWLSDGTPNVGATEGPTSGAPSAKLPELARNQSYTLVLVWYDEETRCFAKRTYYVVTGRSQRVTTPNQNLVYRAERMAETSGFTDEPDLTPI